ncbi:MAG: cation diffusion facilitator family transporter [Thermoanaerobaculales bacterium]
MRSLRPLALTMALTAATMVAEFVGGLLTGSLALLADAGHMLTDVAALGLSLFAAWAAQRPATPSRTYGFYRMEILAALVNGATLIALSAWIFVVAIERLAHPTPVKGWAMLAIASGGLLVNLTALWILRDARTHTLNERGAWLHVLADALGSVEAIIAGALISVLGWNWADPVASLLIGCLVLYSSWRLVRESVAVLMEGTPGSIDLDEVRAAIATVEGVVAVHDLHVWTITSGFVALSAHVIARVDSPEDVLWRIRDLLDNRFGIAHSTIQVETAAAPSRITFPPPPNNGGWT